MRVTTYIISDLNEFLKIEEDWDSFMYENSDNPFLLSRFIKGFIEINRANGWTVFVIIIKSENNILAIAPLMMRRSKLGFNSGTFLVIPTALSSDLIIHENFRKTCIRQIINLLIKKNFKLLDLTMEATSTNLHEMLRYFKKRKFNVFYHNPGQAASHSIINVSGSWDKFCSLRGRLFRKDLKRYKRKLDSAGSWRVEKFENVDDHVVGEVFAVERNSWKQEFRSKQGIKQDETLKMLINALQSKPKKEPDLTWAIWLLYLDNQPIAYCLVLKYKRKAFIVKGSYDKKWKHLYPGIYIKNEVIKSMFGTNVETVDFLTELPYHRKWATNRMYRVRIVLVKGITAKIYVVLSTFKIIRKLLSVLNKLVSYK